MSKFNKRILKSKLSKILTGYELISDPKSDSLFYVKKQELREFRDENKSLIRTRNRIVYVSGEMYKRPAYKGINVNFKYLIIYTRAKERLYGCKTWHDIEYKKIYASGKSDTELIEDLVKHDDFL